jgi:hypothetical protein
LFEDSEELVKLYQALDTIKFWYGKDAVGRGGRGKDYVS